MPLSTHTTIPAESQQLNYPLCSLEIPCLSPAPCPSSRRHIKTRSWALVLINIPPDLFAKLEIIVLVCWPTSSVQIAFRLTSNSPGSWRWLRYLDVPCPLLCCAHRMSQAGSWAAGMGENSPFGYGNS